MNKPISIENPAEQAATQALNRIYDCIEKRKNFILEAGAGAGKTYSLIKALNYLIDKEGTALVHQHKKIACITFTNVAKHQIDLRTDRHPAIHTDTIHAFCWSLIRNFQPELRKELPSIGKWSERITEAGLDNIALRGINYDFGYPSIEEEYVNLYHDDVLDLTIALLKNAKFRTLFIDRYPILFIDEYQDTYKNLADAIQHHFLGTEVGPLIGFFGDHWQKIYGSGCGKIEAENLETIDKNSNFRSVINVVDVLNNMRPELIQFVKNPEIKGTAAVYHTNNWRGTRRTEPHWKGDLPPDVAHNSLEKIKGLLISEGWDFSPEKSKILMLTHNILADEQGYRRFADVFKYNDLFIKKEDKHVAFFVDTLEPVCAAYELKKYGEMFSLMGGGPAIHSHEDKLKWERNMDVLMKLRVTGTIGQVIDHLLINGFPRLPESVLHNEKEFKNFVFDPNEEEPSFITRLRDLKTIPYKQITAFANFSNEHTPFATKHSVKGAEFENVLVVVGRGWNQYNFGEMLEWAGSRIPANKQEAFERSRNLFYVACSRPKMRLAILFTQELPSSALATLNKWFGSSMVHPI